METPDRFLLCFATGVLWSIASFCLGSLHLTHGHAGHLHTGHGHGTGHQHAHLATNRFSWLSGMVHPSAVAVFLTWFGGIGYLLTRHTGWRLWADLVLAGGAGLVSAWLLGSFLRALQSRGQPLDPADYEMVGVLGKVSCPIRPDGIGEVIYLRDGARKPVAARSDGGLAIGYDEEVIVTRYERGIAYVRTWAAMIPQSTMTGFVGEALRKEIDHVE